MNDTQQHGPAEDGNPDDLRTLTPGLEQGNKLSDAAPARAPLRGEALLDAAASGMGLLAEEEIDLVDYYLTNRGLPGDDKPRKFEVDVGNGETKRTAVWTVRPIEYDEWRDANQQAYDEEKDQTNAYIVASLTVARSLVHPKLGPAVARLRALAEAEADGKIEEADGTRRRPPRDAAELLRRMFARNSGSLFELSGNVTRISKITDGGSLVREVEAGKP